MLERWLQPGALPIGIDLGASGAKIVQLRNARGQHSVIAAARADAPPDLQGPDRLRGLAEAAARKIEAARCVGRKCVISVDNRLVRVRSVRLPRLSDEDTTRALQLDGAERLGFEPGRAQLGWLRAGELRQGEDAREEILLVGAASDEVEASVDALTSAGLTPVAVEPSFFACARALGRFFRRQSDEKHVRMAVDAGSRSAAVMVLRGDRVAFCKLLEWGGDRLDEAASQKLNLDLATVSEIRRQRRARGWGDTGDIDERVDRAMFDAVRPLLQELAHEVMLCMRYWMVTFRGERPEAVILVGGEAEEPRLPEVIAEATGIETRVGRPLEGMDISGATFSGADRRGALSQWATAVGLSLRADQSSLRRSKPEPEAPADADERKAA